MADQDDRRGDPANRLNALTGGMELRLVFAQGLMGRKTPL
jgi:hypothetical protein